MSVKKQYILVTRGSCPYCESAVSLLKENKLNFSYTDMEFNREALHMVSREFDWNTVPIIWEQEVDWENEARVLESTFIGGYSELKKHLELEDCEEEVDEVSEDD
tara:strand:+ start:3697 stop:4011 length:315 start_codon:yes stop_codon:yes gene_type:complete